jgi:signal transduction histidine kinase
VSVAPVSVRTLLAAGPPVLAGVVALWLALALARRPPTLSLPFTSRSLAPPTDATTASVVYTDLRRPFVWTCLTVGGLLVVYGVGRATVQTVSAVAVTGSFLYFLAWTVFALQFVGRGHLVTRRRVATALVVVVLTNGLALAEVVGLVPSTPGAAPVVSVVLSIVALGLLAVVFTVAGLVVLSTYRHRSLSVLPGFAVVLPTVVMVLGVQVVRPSEALLNDVVLGVTSVAVVGTLLLAATRYDVLSVRPGTGTAGERAALREMDTPIVTVERGGRIARANEAATALFGDRLDTEGLAAVLEAPAALTDRDTVACWTERGRRRFDPRVTPLENDDGQVVGHTVVLIDVTDRELRRQRIEVLNRTLRHNVRNKLDVINAHAEALAEQPDEHRPGERPTDSADDPAPERAGERAAAILSATDALDRLSADARRVETLLGRSADERTPADPTAVAESVAASVAETHPAASVRVDCVPTSVTTDAKLLRLALTNLLENAVEHNDSDRPRAVVRGVDTEDGYRLTVADDGPGLPEAERAVIERRRESPTAHARGLGLWSANWAIQRLGGDLSFAESDLGGAAVVVELPAPE